VIFDNKIGKIMDKNERIVLIVDRVDELYYLREGLLKCNVTTERKRESLETWHRRMGHLNARDLVESVRHEKIYSIDLSTRNDKLLCKVCIRGKITRAPFPKNTDRKSKLLEIVHYDVCGSMRIESNGEVLCDVCR